MKVSIEPNPVRPDSYRVVLQPGQRMPPASRGAGHFTPGYYFYVPSEVTEFSVEDISAHGTASIRDPDGHPAWENTAGGTRSVTITVSPEHAGRLWRIRGGTFVMDASIPPYYAIDADRWFDYSPYLTPEYPASRADPHEE